MEHVIENETLRATLTTWGAQVKSVVRKADGVEHIWQADRSVWGYHAPIAFPHCGRLADDKFEAKGRIYASRIHGFARDMEHELTEGGRCAAAFALRSSDATRELFPYEFTLTSSFALEGNALHHTLTVRNLDSDVLRFGIGSHPGFRVPFDSDHTISDYELRFSEAESPLCLETSPSGLLTGRTYRLGSGITSIPIGAELFAGGGHCMTELRSRTLGIYERGSGRAAVCDISSFPYVLIWSEPDVPGFVCIEPWHGLPSAEGSSIKWDEKPAAATLTTGEEWSCTLSTSFVRRGEI